MHQFVIWWLFSLSGVVHASVQTCYFPDKTVAAADVPCNGASSTSACCNFNDVCLDNGLCLQSEGPALMSRGSCTDSTWSSNQCPQFCQDVTLNYGQAVYPLINNKFCCGAGFATNVSCNASTHGSYEPFYVVAGNVIYNRSDGSIGPNTTTFTTIAPSDMNTRLAIGAGVGLPLGFALFIVIGLLLIEIRRKRDKQQEAKAWERKFLGVVRQKMFEGKGNKERKSGGPLAELSGWPMDELHGDSPVSNEFVDKP